MRDEQHLAEQRAARDAARAAAISRARRLKNELAPAKIGERIASDLAYRAREAAVQAVEIAGDNRGILAGAATALGLWLARKQAGSGAMALWRMWRARKFRTPETESEQKTGT